MRVTAVRLDQLVSSETKGCKGVLGKFTVVLYDEICIHNMRVIKGGRGLFVAFPHTGLIKESGGGKRFSDVVHPIKQEVRDEIESEVLACYARESTKSNAAKELKE